jgi:hypothetical protein
VACNGLGTIKSGTATDLGGFIEGGYWSSSEDDATNARLQYLQDGEQSKYDKDYDYFVRPVRAF